MSTRIILFIFSSLLLAGCVQMPTFKDETSSLITSNYPILKVNGVNITDGADTASVYRYDLEPGENTLVIVYNTYKYDYFCRFTWVAEANTAYEVTDQENRYPLTLYRWVRTNSLWANRLDPVDPLECTVGRHDGSVE